PPGAMAPGGAPAEDLSSRVARSSRALEIGAALATLLVSGALLMLALGISVRTETGGVDPRWWPLVLSGIGLALSALLLVVALVRPPFERDDLEVTGRDGWARLVLAVVISALYLVAWDLVGFVLPTLVFLAALLWVFGRRGWKGLLLFPIAMTAFIYGLFDLVLKVPL
ncbi:MAG TPA: tripartite tricarboxylate transporter TctB family protein, partial [Naasia sp.]